MKYWYRNGQVCDHGMDLFSGGLLKIKEILVNTSLVKERAILSNLWFLNFNGNISKSNHEGLLLGSPKLLCRRTIILREFPPNLDNSP